MKCPRCGAETDGKNNYCQKCGADLHPRDNSSDDTLRLPDLSGVPLGGQPIRSDDGRRRESGGERRDGSRALKVTLVVCVLAITAAVAVCLAMVLTHRGEGPDFENRPEQNDSYQTDSDYDTYDEPESTEPENPETEQDKEEPERANIEAEEMPQDSGEDTEPSENQEPESEKPEDIPELTDPEPETVPEESVRPTEGLDEEPVVPPEADNGVAI